MNHESCRERLLDLVYGELPGREAREAERHLETCDACRAERDRLLDTRGAMGRLEAPHPPERVDRVVLAAARRAAEERGGGGFAAALRGFGAKLAAGTGLAVLLALVVLNLGRVRDKGPLEGARRASQPVAEPYVERNEPQVEPQQKPAGPGPRPGPGPWAEPPRPAPARPLAAKKEAARAESSAPKEGTPEARSSVRAAPAAPPPPGLARDDGRSRDGEGSSLRQPQRGAEEREAKLGAPSRAAKAAPIVPEGGAGPTTGEAGPATELARGIERRHAAGELSEAVRRFEPCPGGDQRRTAWIDREQRVVKLVRERAGVWIEEWFDASGRLREALVHGRAGGAPWTRRVVVGEDGAGTSEDASGSGLAPESPPPPLVERDPSGAFFAGPGCAP